MSKKLMVAAAVGCAACAFLAGRCCREEGERPTMWEKMSQRMEEMPENFPPRIMFDNLVVTRENTERILEILEGREPASKEDRQADET
jgi:hypothetical protein